MLHAYVQPTFTQDSYFVALPKWDDGPEPELACMGYGEFSGRGNFQWDNAYEGFWIFLIIESGHGLVSVNRGPNQKLGPGDVLVMRPDAFYHRVESADHPWRYRWVVLSGSRAGRILTSLGWPADQVLPRFGLGSKLEGVFAHMRLVLAKEQPSFLELCGLGWDFVRALGGATENPSAVQADGGKAGVAVEWLRQNYQTGCTVEDAAAAMKLSRSGFFRLFRSQTGQSPKAYLDHLRLEHAMHLLRQGGYTVKEIAQRSGYRDFRHFTQAFTRKKGVPPQTWARTEAQQEGCGPVTRLMRQKMTF